MANETRPRNLGSDADPLWLTWYTSNGAPYARLHRGRIGMAISLSADELAALITACHRGNVVDGPGCTPAAVPNELGELVAAGSLYADKCAECTTGHSCEDAGRCLLEG